MALERKEKDIDSVVENQKRVEENVDGIMSRISPKWLQINMEAVEDTQKRMDVLMNSLDGKSVNVNSVHNCVEDAVKVQLLEWIWFGSRVNLARIPERFRSLQVRGSDIECADVVRDLGVYT